MTERRGRGSRPALGEDTPTRAVPLFQAQPIRRRAEPATHIDDAVTRAYVRHPPPAPRSSAARPPARAARRIGGALLALLLLAAAGVAGLTAAGGGYRALTLQLGVAPAPGVTPSQAAALLARRDYRRALAVYRSLARAHPHDGHYGVIAELIEARLDASAGPSR